MDISSFTGGNVEDWAPFLESLPPRTTHQFNHLPTSATIRFNFAEAYFGSDLTTPREFLRYPADQHINYWVTRNATVDADYLYSQLLPLFDSSFPLPTTPDNTIGATGSVSGVVTGGTSPSPPPPSSSGTQPSGTQPSGGTTTAETAANAGSKLVKYSPLLLAVVWAFLHLV